MNKKTPITIFTGHLGSGKTTLIQKVLKLLDDKEILVIENEFGEIGIDGEILAQSDNTLVELNAGCICCNIQSDLENILARYIADKKEFDHIIIEATGVANPSTIARQFIEPNYLSNFFELSSIISVVDSVHYLKHRELPEFELQLLTSDTFYLSKLNDDNRDSLEKICEVLNITSENIIGDEQLKDWLEIKSFFKIDDSLSKKGGHSHYQKISLEFVGELDPFTLENCLNVLFMQYMGRIFRSKGVLHFRKAPHPVVFQGVFDSISFEEMSELKDEKKINRIVFIGKDLNEASIEASLKNYLADEG